MQEHQIGACFGELTAQIRGQKQSVGEDFDGVLPFLEKTDDGEQFRMKQRFSADETEGADGPESHDFLIIILHLLKGTA